MKKNIPNMEKNITHMKKNIPHMKNNNPIWNSLFCVFCSFLLI